MKQDEPAEWIPKDAFVMPVLPPDLSIEPLLAALLHLASFLELSGSGLGDRSLGAHGILFRTASDL
jgi:hypothetical protein